MTSIVWFRQDLRLRDNPALTEAARHGAVLPVFILEEEGAGRRLGGASRWWLHHSLAALAAGLGQLTLLRGDPLILIPTLIEQSNASAIYWNRCYDRHSVARDKKLKALLLGRNLEVKSFNGSLLHEPWEVMNGSGEPFKVFTPFWRKCFAQPISAPLPAPQFALPTFPRLGDRLDDWGLLPSRPNWAAGWGAMWQPGEEGAL